MTSLQQGWPADAVLQNITRDACNAEPQTVLMAQVAALQ
jgi:hypothetical protein